MIELKQYYLVKFRNGNFGIVLTDVPEDNHPHAIMTGDNSWIIVTDDKSWLDSTNYTDNLLIEPSSIEGYKNDLTIDEYDIMAIYDNPFYIGNTLSFNPKYRELLWERKPKRKMTLNQIQKELGYEIEIVEE